MASEPVSLEEAVVRRQQDAETRAEVAREQALDAEGTSARDRGFLALVFGVTLYGAGFVLAWALILGIAVRVFRLVAYW